jgi:Flp pilus assembly protein TadG
MNARPAQCVRRQRGIAIVEFVIVAPILLLLMLMASELGRALFQYNALTKAVRDGARYYSAPGTFDSEYAGLTPAELAERAANLVTFGNTGGAGDPLLPGSLDVPDPVTITDATGTYVTVTAHYTFEFLPGNPLQGFMSFLGGSGTLPFPFVMTASTTMRKI